MVAAADLARERYVYYRCSFAKGQHNVPYLPEAKLEGMLGETVNKIMIPAFVAENIVAAFKSDHERIDVELCSEFDSANQRLNELEGFKLRGYPDRLRGVIEEALRRSSTTML